MLYNFWFQAFIIILFLKFIIWCTRYEEEVKVLYVIQRTYYLVTKTERYKEKYLLNAHGLQKVHKAV